MTLDDYPHFSFFDKYYLALMAYCSLFKPNISMDLGHNFGDSAYALSPFSNKVFTYDISEVGRNHVNTVKLMDNVEFILLPGPEDCLDLLFEEFDLIFVDIDHHGPRETKIHQKIQQSGYKGIVFWDDVRLTNGMKDFWRDLDIPRVIQEWHGPTGFGVALYE